MNALTIAIDAAQAFADGGERTKALRDSAWAAHRAAQEARDAEQAAASDAGAAGHAVGAAFLHLDGRSDYDAFVAAGIPAGGLFTGVEDIKTQEQQDKWGGTAGDAFDPCYHQACDTFTNVDEHALDEMTDAMAHAILTFAMTTSAVQGTDKGSDKATYDPTFRGPRAIK